MELKGRLQLIAKKVSDCDIVCDIGTDHAYIPIYLFLKGKCKRAIAADIKKGPIEAATNNIKGYGLENFIETRVGDGLAPIKEDEVDIIVIAGMGGILIKEILEIDLNKAKKAKKIILQPMNAFEILREWLYRNGFEISDEELESEGNKIYNVIVVRWTGNCSEKNDLYYNIGKKLIENKDPLLERFLLKKIKDLNSAIKEMEKACEQGLESRDKYIKLRDGMKRILDKEV